MADPGVAVATAVSEGGAARVLRAMELFDRGMTEGEQDRECVVAAGGDDAAADGDEWGVEFAAVCWVAVAGSRWRRPQEELTRAAATELVTSDHIADRRPRRHTPLRAKPALLRRHPSWFEFKIVGDL